jgi:hypothetical protein
MLTRALLAFVFVTTSAPADTQIVPGDAAADQSEITVTGRKDSKQAVKDFVRDLTPIASSARISRLERLVCPAAFGIPKAQAVAVARRMRQVAKSVSLAVAGDNCVPNVLVLVTADKRALLELIRKQRPDYLVSLSEKDVDELENSAGPAAAWQLADSDVNADGAEIPWDPKSQWSINSTIDPPSRITVPARTRFYAAIVVVERSALAGLTTTQLADYAALRAYTGANPARLRNSNVPTILRILEAPMGTAIPLTMTSWDFGFLRGFYSSRRDLGTAAQRSSIANTMANEIDAIGNH